MSTLPILTFHSIDETDSVISLSPGTFGRAMEQLAAAGWRGCSLSEALAPHRDGPAERRVALTFDDGYRNVREEALPVLQALGFTATVFAIAGRCGRDNRWPGQPASIPDLPLLDWGGLDALLQAGWEIGSHGVEHAALPGVDPQLVARDLEESRNLLEKTLDTTVPLFAYPYGAHNTAVRDIARRIYTAACGTRLALATAADRDDGFRLPRVDAYYLRRFSAPAAIGSLRGRVYLAARRTARRLRHSGG